MPSSRRKRFKRADALPPLRLTERDRTIVRLVHRNRFLRSSHIVALVGGHSQPILRRLQLLYHHGFLERPRAQIEYFRQGGSHHMVYGLGRKGASLLKEELGASFRPLDWGEKNASVGRIFFDHALLVSDVMVALELGCRAWGDVGLLAGDDLPLKAGCRRPQPFKWHVQVNNSLRLGIVPDRVFTLKSDGESGNPTPTLFCLEADRGTTPIFRKNFVQSSFYRKLVAYEATWSQGLHRVRFGFHRFRVLIVTTSAARVQSLVDACSKLKRGHGLFLICDRATLAAHSDIFTVPWHTGRQGEIVRLLD
jgi:protein involved in plasmid replication-relaxation